MRRSRANSGNNDENITYLYIIIIKIDLMITQRMILIAIEPSDIIDRNIP